MAAVASVLGLSIALEALCRPVQAARLPHLSGAGPPAPEGRRVASMVGRGSN